MSDIKFFFMAQMRATLQGKPQSEFNSVTRMDTRNVLAADLTRIQHAAAAMLEGKVDFDDVVITNLFFLAECTQEEFFGGVAQPEAEAFEGLEEAVAESLALAEDADASAEADAAYAADDADLAEAPSPGPNSDDGNVEQPFNAEDTEDTNR